MLRIILDEDADDGEYDDDDDDDEEEEDEENDEDPYNIQRFQSGARRLVYKDLDERNAGWLYGLIHSRFILTSKGLSLMKEKYKSGIYGCCPSIHCENAKLLPTAVSEIPNFIGPFLYCPRCCETYHPPRNSLMHELDGSFFGTTFAPFFALSFNIASDKKTAYYVPQIYGFRIHRNVREQRYMLSHKDNDSDSVDESS